MEVLYPNAWLKAQLLARRTVGFSDNVTSNFKIVDVENHHRDEYVFIKLGKNSRVRLVVAEHPEFLIDADQNGVLVLQDYKTKELLIRNVIMEDVVIHAPQQLFLGLYEYCRVGCKFCPLSLTHGEHIHYSLDSIFEDIEKSKNKNYTSIGITTAIPYYLSSDDVADEMIFVVSKIRQKVGNSIPIGISTRISSKEKLTALKEAGATEARLNIEVAGSDLSKLLMPNKPSKRILESIKFACDVFGKGKVSSNIILGLGETDENILILIERLAEIGAIATLYPYDPTSCSSVDNNFKRPSAERIYNLAIAHKEILEHFSLNTNSLLTMCPACAASHVFPGKDL